MIFEPAVDAYRTQWLDLADRLRLDRELTELPELTELLERHYNALLSRGDRNPDDRAVRYVTRFDVLDLNDHRWKPDTHATNPASEADLARRAGARRQGILPTLASWVSLAVGEMHDVGQWHTEPADPDRIVWTVDPDGTTTATRPGPTIASETSWLRRHLDWIFEQQWSIDLADEVHRIVADLDSLGINLDGPDHHATSTVAQLADLTGVPAATIYHWIRLGYLTHATDTRPRHYIRHEVETLRDNGPQNRFNFTPSEPAARRAQPRAGVDKPRADPNYGH